MSKPIRPRQALNNWSATEIGTSSFKIATLKTPKQLEARLKLAFMAGFDSGTHAERHRAKRAK